MSEKFSIVVLLFMSNFVLAQDLTPLMLVEKVFTDTSFITEIPNYCTGEFEGRPNSADLAEGTKLSFKILEENSKTAVVNMTVVDRIGKGLDTYIHLTKEETWKIEAFRALAMTGLLEEIQKEFEMMTEVQIDSLIAHGDDVIKSREDFYRELENIKLTLEFDDNIISHFEKHKNKFTEILEELSKVKISEEGKSIRTKDLDNYINTDYKSLLISNVTTSHYCDECYEFSIGGMLDNYVGYLYVGNKDNLPKMNSERIIMLREIGDGWYLFKTT